VQQDKKAQDALQNPENVHQNPEDVPRDVLQNANVDVPPKSAKVVVLTKENHALVVGRRDVLGQRAANVPKDIAVGLRIENKENKE
jgi:hypothetical protein